MINIILYNSLHMSHEHVSGAGSQLSNFIYEHLPFLDGDNNKIIDVGEILPALVPAGLMGVALCAAIMFFSGPKRHL